MKVIAASPSRRARVPGIRARSRASTASATEFAPEHHGMGGGHSMKPFLREPRDEHVVEPRQPALQRTLAVKTFKGLGEVRLGGRGKRDDRRVALGKDLAARQPEDRPPQADEAHDVAGRQHVVLARRPHQRGNPPKVAHDCGIKSRLDAAHGRGQRFAPENRKFGDVAVLEVARLCQVASNSTCRTSSRMPGLWRSVSSTTARQSRPERPRTLGHHVDETVGIGRAPQCQHKAPSGPVDIVGHRTSLLRDAVRRSALPR